MNWSIVKIYGILEWENDDMGDKDSISLGSKRVTL